jgi:hypothetical protein
MNQLVLTFLFSNFLLQEHPPVQRLSFPEDNSPGGGAFCPSEINRWIARWENERGAVAVEGNANYVLA